MAAGSGHLLVHLPGPAWSRYDRQMLAQYTSEVQGFLNDAGGQFFTVPTVESYINRARRRVASVSACLRVMPPGTRTHPGQEIYPFKDWLSLVQGVMPGIGAILYCRTLAIAMGSRQGWKPMWRNIVFSDFQARFRIYNGTYYGTFSEPGWWAQYGWGTAGSIYLAPIPAQDNPMEVDLTCVPAPLLSDDDPEPLPYPWRDAVSYWAAMLCLMQQQRREDAQTLATLFNDDLPMCAAVVCPQMIQTAYGAVKRSA